MVCHVGHGFVGSLCAYEDSQLIPQVAPQLSVLAAELNSRELKESFSRLSPMLHDGISHANTRRSVGILGASVGEDKQGITGDLFELFVMHVITHPQLDHIRQRKTRPCAHTSAARLPNE